MSPVWKCTGLGVPAYWLTIQIFSKSTRLTRVFSMPAMYLPIIPAM